MATRVSAAAEAAKISQDALLNVVGNDGVSETALMHATKMTEISYNLLSIVFPLTKKIPKGDARSAATKYMKIAAEASTKAKKLIANASLKIPDLASRRSLRIAHNRQKEAFTAAK